MRMSFTRWLLTVSVIVFLAGFAAAEQTGKPKNITQDLREIRELLADESKPEGERIDKALALLDKTMKKTGPELLIPSDPADQPFNGTAIFKNDPFFDNPSAFSGNWDPFKEMERMRAMTDHLYSGAFRRFNQSPQFGALAQQRVFTPGLDLTEEDGNYVVRADLPGVDRGNIEVSVEGQVLTISGKKEEAIQQKNAKGQIIRQERQMGTFQRSMTLPGPIEATRVEAQMENGVLVITIPKKKDGKQGNVRIEVQ